MNVTIDTANILADFGYKLDATGVTVNLTLNKEMGFIGTDGGMEGEEAKGGGEEDNSLKRPCHCWDGELINGEREGGWCFYKGEGRLGGYVFVRSLSFSFLVGVKFHLTRSFLFHHYHLAPTNMAGCSSLCSCSLPFSKILTFENILINSIHNSSDEPLANGLT